MQRTRNRNEQKQAEQERIPLLAPTDLYSEAERRLAELEKIRTEKEKALKHAPNGMIHIVHTKKRVSFYLRMDAPDKSGRYLPQSDASLIRRYVQKAYDTKIFDLVGKEITSLRRFLKSSGPISDQIRRRYSDQPEKVREYLVPIDLTDEDYARTWMGQPYTGKAVSPETPCYETERKERVRSKSELNIANALARHNIPYKYECPLVMHDGRTVYPDFTVLDIRNRKVFYWEHRGMMDDPEYADRSVSRIKAYLRNGIVIGKDLIITEETSSSPLGTNEIEVVIRRFFG